MPTNYVAVGAVCLAGIGLAVRELWKWRTTQHLGQQGLSAAATILAVQTVAQPKGGPVQRLEVVYRTHSGTQYRRWLVAENNASEEEYVVGDEVAICYDARHPDHCVLESILTAPWWESPLYRGILLLGIFGYFLWQAVLHLRT
ncbi:DUF3592 domain-containing protein [Hymenobacter mucosus]|uniref:DUF3592 domain-containing protein n=1 Tax=Hymenobacter mucosus TaxID=1411120 RepID=A0A239BH28_9BACT|nr:Protein of unknown function [Hymenobacter mucosus]